LLLRVLLLVTIIPFTSYYSTYTDCYRNYHNIIEHSIGIQKGSERSPLYIYVLFLLLLKRPFEKSVSMDAIFYTSTVGYLYVLLTIKTGQQSRFFYIFQVLPPRSTTFIYSWLCALTNTIFIFPSTTTISRIQTALRLTTHNAIVYLSSRDNIIIQLPTVGE